MTQAAQGHMVLRRTGSNKEPLKEKVVAIYEALFQVGHIETATWPPFRTDLTFRCRAKILRSISRGFGTKCSSFVSIYYPWNDAWCSLQRINYCNLVRFFKNFSAMHSLRFRIPVLFDVSIALRFVMTPSPLSSWT